MILWLNFFNFFSIFSFLNWWILACIQTFLGVCSRFFLLLLLIRPFRFLFRMWIGPNFLLFWYCSRSSVLMSLLVLSWVLIGLLLLYWLLDAEVVHIDPEVFAIVGIDHKLNGRNVLLHALGNICNLYGLFCLLCYLSLWLNHYVMNLILLFWRMLFLSLLKSVYALLQCSFLGWLGYYYTVLLAIGSTALVLRLGWVAIDTVALSW